MSKSNRIGEEKIIILVQYKGCIPEKLYYAMYEYKVEIDD